MLYSNVHGNKISRLAFGMMRLPQTADGQIDEERTAALVDHAIKNGVNYFDTAYPYHGGMSERVTGKLLAKYPRDSYFLATKFPGHQISETYDAKAIFEEQLEKCGVEYFDYYLLHNVYEKSAGVYLDPKWGIIDYLVEQRRLGRIRHLGFSCHGRPDNLREFLDACGDKMEFCQIQINYLDWTLQEAKEKYELLTERGIPVWVMEPVRGGRLAHLSEADEKLLRDLRPDETPAAWAFRWLTALPNVATILSGMSDMAQLEDNLKTFSSERPLNGEENDLLARLAEKLKNSLPCTACRYCCDGCPAGLDIPGLIALYNELRFGLEGRMTPAMQVQALPPEQLPTACIGCGACAQICPQKIDIPQAMKDFSEMLPELPQWDEICKQRAAENAANQARYKKAD